MPLANTRGWKSSRLSETHSRQLHPLRSRKSTLSNDSSVREHEQERSQHQPLLRSKYALNRTLASRSPAFCTRAQRTEFCSLLLSTAGIWNRLALGTRVASPGYKWSCRAGADEKFRIVLRFAIRLHNAPVLSLSRNYLLPL